MLVGVTVWQAPFGVGFSASGVSHWCYADAVLAFFGGACALQSTLGATREALLQLLMACPRHLNLMALKRSVSEVPGVDSLHDLHVWQIGRSRSCSAHLVIRDVNESVQILRACTAIAKSEHGLDEVTFQIEIADNFDTENDRLRLSSITCHDTR